jgi:succinyl-diaminopimelate desuccinylase
MWCVNRRTGGPLVRQEDTVDHDPARPSEPPIGALLAHLDARASDLTVALQEMIRVRSVNPAFDPDAPGEAAMADDVERRYRALGCSVERHESVPGRPNLVVRVPGTGTSAAPHLLVNAHLDTVAADVGEWYDPFTGARAAPWHVDPYAGELVQGRIYGRGAADHKSPIAALLFAIEALQATGTRLRGDLTCIHDVDEETGGEHGIHHLATVMPFDFDMVLYACSSEFTPLGREFFTAMGSDNVIRAFAGWHVYRIRVGGQSLHNLTPRHAFGAAEAALPLLDQLRSLADRVNADVVPIEGRGQPRMRVSAIDSGVRAAFLNQAQTCEIVVNRRIPAGTAPAEALAEMEAIVAEHNARYPDNAAELSLERDIRPHETSADHPVVGAFVRAVERVTGRTPTVTGLPAPVGISALLQHRALPTVLFGYGHLNQHHAPNEFITEEALLDMAKTYAVGLVHVLGVDDE